MLACSWDLWVATRGPELHVGVSCPRPLTVDAPGELHHVTTTKLHVTETHITTLRDCESCVRKCVCVCELVHQGTKMCQNVCMYVC